MGPEPETAGAKGATFAGFAMMPALSLAPPVASARVGADADIIVFDPAAVRDNSTIERDTIPAAGIYRVVFRYAKVLTNVQAGQAIRRPACWGMMVQGTRHSIQYPSAMRRRLWCTAAGLRRRSMVASIPQGQEMTDFRLLVPVLWAGVISMMPGTAVVADSSAEDDWQFNAGAYPYAAGTKGETASGSDLDVSFTALIDNLDMAFMGNVEARKSNWPRAADVLYLNVGAGGGYREPRSEQATLDLVAGARYLEVSSFLDMSTRLGPLARSRGVAASGNSRDIIIGMRGDVYLKDNCYAPYDADLGTGDSDFTWQIAGWIGYKFDWVTPTSSPVTWTGISNPAPSSTISISADHS